MYRNTATWWVSIPAVLLLLVTAVEVPQLWAQPQQIPDNGWRNYTLVSVNATDAQSRLQRLLSQSGLQFEMQVDARTNQLFVRGDQQVQQVALQTIRVLERSQTSTASPPPANPATASPVPRGYTVARDRLAGTVSWVRKQFPSVRAAADERLSRVMVIATPQEHQQIAAALSSVALPTGQTATPPASFGNRAPWPNGGIQTSPVQPVAFGQQRQLTSLTAEQLQSILRQQLGSDVQVTRNPDGSAIVAVKTPQGPMPVLQIDQSSHRVAVNANAPVAKQWRQLAAALDTPNPGPNQAKQVVPLRRADPETVRQAINILQTGRKSGQTVAAVPVGAPARQAAFLNNIFQQDGGGDAVQDAAPQADAQAVPDEQAINPDENPDLIGDDEAGGLLGPVKIEYIEGFGLVITGNKRDVARIQAIIDKIETLSVKTKPMIEVYPMKHADSKAVAELVLGLYESVYGVRQSPVSITGLGKPNAILLIGAPESITTMLDLIAKLDTEVDPDSQLKVINLLHMSAVDAAALVNNFYGAAVTTRGTGGQQGNQDNETSDLLPRIVAIADYRSNSVIVQASPRDLKEIELFLEKIDVETSPASSELKVFRLQYALATELQQVLVGALAGQANGGQQALPGVQGNQVTQAGGAGSQATAPMGAVTIQNEQGVPEDGGILAGVTITAEPNVNALVVRAPSRSMALIAELIGQLDRLPEAQAQIKVFPIENGDAILMAQLLQQLFGQPVNAGLNATNQAFNQALRQTNTVGGGPAESQLIPLSFAPDVRTNSVIVTGSEGDLETVEVLIFRLDESGVEQRTTRVHRLKNAPANDVATAIQNYLTSQSAITQAQIQLGIQPSTNQIDREVIVIPELVTNSLIVSASPRYYEEILNVIEDLDFRPKMVMVQAVIAEVLLTDDFELGVELGLQDSLLFNRGITSGGTPGTPGFNFNSTGALPNANTFGQGQLAGQALSNLALGREGLTGAGGLVLSAASESVNLLVRALQEEGRLQVLSRPQIKTLDGEFAFVQVGQTVSRITGSTNNSNQGGGITNNVTDVETGLLLRVTPRINQDGLVIMTVDVENSKLGDENDGVVVATSEAGPVRSPNIEIITAQTTLTAQTGQTVVFAGLIQKRREVNTRKVPFLGDVPLLGNLFRYDQEGERRAELLIFLTPYVINDDADVDMVKFVESERMSWCLADILEIHGDAGLSGGHGLWGRDTGPVVYPAIDPTGAAKVPTGGEHVPAQPYNSPQLPPTPMVPAGGSELDRQSWNTTRPMLNSRVQQERLQHLQQTQWNGQSGAVEQPNRPANTRPAGHTGGTSTASRIPVYGPVRQAAVYPIQESPALPQQSGPTRLPATQ